MESQVDPVIAKIKEDINGLVAKAINNHLQRAPTPIEAKKVHLYSANAWLKVLFYDKLELGIIKIDLNGPKVDFTPTPGT